MGKVRFLDEFDFLGQNAQYLSENVIFTRFSVDKMNIGDKWYNLRQFFRLCDKTLRQSETITRVMEGRISLCNLPDQRKNVSNPHFC